MLVDVLASTAAVEARARARAALIEAGRSAGGDAAGWADVAALVLENAEADARLIPREDADEYYALAVACAREIVDQVMGGEVDRDVADARLARVPVEMFDLPMARRRLALWIAAARYLATLPLPPP